MLPNLCRMRDDNGTNWFHVSRARTVSRMADDVAAIAGAHVEWSTMIRPALNEPVHFDSHEAELVGAREAAVARLEMDGGELLPSQIVGSDPYDPMWDGLIALDDDPLTRIRQMTSILRESIVLGESAMNLKRIDDDDDE